MESPESIELQVKNLIAEHGLEALSADRWSSRIVLYADFLEAENVANLAADDAFKRLKNYAGSSSEEKDLLTLLRLLNPMESIGRSQAKLPGMMVGIVQKHDELSGLATELENELKGLSELCGRDETLRKVIDSLDKLSDVAGQIRDRQLAYSEQLKLISERYVPIVKIKHFSDQWTCVTKTDIPGLFNDKETHVTKTDFPGSFKDQEASVSNIDFPTSFKDQETTVIKIDFPETFKDQGTGVTNIDFPDTFKDQETIVTKTDFPDSFNEQETIVTKIDFPGFFTDQETTVRKTDFPESYKDISTSATRTDLEDFYLTQSTRTDFSEFYADKSTSVTEAELLKSSTDNLPSVPTPSFLKWCPHDSMQVAANKTVTTVNRSTSKSIRLMAFVSFR